LVIFDPINIKDSATFADPMRPAAGIHQVYVNGVLSWQDGVTTHARAGQVLRRA
jgi:N-acyl-D-amino-acid deacylase